MVMDVRRLQYENAPYYLQDEGEALWGYLDAWGDFVRGLLNPVLPSAEIVI